MFYYLTCGLTNGTVNGSNSLNSGIKEENNGAVNGESGVIKAHKGMTLRKSVDYIRYGFFILTFLMWPTFSYFFARYLQLVSAEGAHNRELEQELKAAPSYSSGCC